MRSMVIQQFCAAYCNHVCIVLGYNALVCRVCAIYKFAEDKEGVELEIGAVCAVESYFNLLIHAFCKIGLQYVGRFLWQDE